MLEEKPSYVPAGPGDTIDVTECNRVVVYCNHKNGNSGGCVPRSTSRSIGGCNDDVRVETNEFGSKVRQLVDLSCGVPVFERDVLTLNVTEVA